MYTMLFAAHRTTQLGSRRFTAPGTAVRAFLMTLPLAVWASSARGQGLVINVEIDYMAGHRPADAELDKVVQMFACHGVTLHYEIDEPAIPYVDVIQCASPSFDEKDFWACSGAANPKSFANIRNTYCRNKGGGWHYCVFGNRHQAVWNEDEWCPGHSQIGGYNFVVTLGNYPGGNGTAWDRAATFAHELGHNLGLRHEGGQSANDVGPYKPNYASIMNLRYRAWGVRSRLICLGLADDASLFKDLDYSDGRLPSIDENALNEYLGVGIHAIDWNCDDILSTAVTKSVDELPPDWCASTGDRTILRDYNDWAHIVNRLQAAAPDAAAEDNIERPLVPERYEPVSASSPFTSCPSSWPPDPAEQPSLAWESCRSGLMIWVNASYSGTQTGIGDQPYNTISGAYNAVPAGSVLYLQPGTYTNGGVDLVLTKAITLAGPGVAVIDP